MKSNVKIIQVLKYEKKYFEIGDIVELVVSNYYETKIIGRIVSLTKDASNIKIDASNNYDSKILDFNVTRILSIKRIEL